MLSNRKFVHFIDGVIIKERDDGNLGRVTAATIGTGFEKGNGFALGLVVFAVAITAISLKRMLFVIRWRPGLPCLPIAHRRILFDRFYSVIQPRLQ
ncbi:hypothetical protein GOZ90_00645 [Agrobacterium vitis]|uniref:Uncharacterized protein n=1 Tax=Agrobacterium vitis TaxID=373 RepID=A0A6L6V5L2_AGRVI|nr:hypothetical protein [Agrobacterium vitis]MUZ71170.1 hypothetical protein [Agrobacterium vitis]MVA57446.1 hypothetical protein [Agrobacterium vitis]